MSFKLYIATHKQTELLYQNKNYKGIQLGSYNKEDLGLIGDDTGNNISDKEDYCELRAQYWFYQNDDSDYVGLAHYRRYFSKSEIFYSMISTVGNEIFVDSDDVEFYLQKYDIIVVKIIFFNKCSARIHSREHNYEIPLDIAGEVIRDINPEYYQSFLDVMEGNVLYPNNMYIAKKEISDKYSKFLFSILFETENRMRERGIEVDGSRLSGAISEYLLKVWIDRELLKVKILSRIKTDDLYFQYLPIYDYSEMTLEYEKTKDNFDVLKTTKNGNSILFGSKCYLKNDLKCLLTDQDLKKESPEAIIIFGLGSGDYLEPLLEVFNRYLSFIVVEPNVEAIKMYIENKKYYYVDNYQDNLTIFPFSKNIFDKLDKIANLKKTLLLPFTNYDVVYREEYNTFKTLMKQIIEGKITKGKAFVTLMRMSKTKN